MNKSDGATDETRNMEKRLIQASQANKAKLTGAAASGPAGASRAAAAQQQQAARQPQFPMNVNVKATLEGETRTITVSLMVSYADLYAQLKARFPEAGAHDTRSH